MPDQSGQASADLTKWTHHEECDWTPEGAAVPCLSEPDCNPYSAQRLLLPNAGSAT